MTHFPRFLTLIAGVIASTAAVSHAAPLVFQIDSELSSLSIDPSASFAPSVPQGPGSWTAAYSGSIVADVTDTTVQLLASTRLVAGVSGDWKPGDVYPSPGFTDTGRAEDDLEYVNASVPANYGSTADLSVFSGPSASDSAVRDVVISLSDASPKPVAGGVFSAAGSLPGFVSGVHYYSYGSSSPSPSSDLTEDDVTILPTTDGDATLSLSGDLLTMTLPVEFSVSYFISSMVYSGTIVATAYVPEPAGASLVLSGGALLLRPRRRRPVLG